MNIIQESLNAQDYNKKIRALTLKSAKLKKKSKALNAQLSATLKECDHLLHPGQKEKK
ncbi:hypothetical protein [Pedobacter heparinus]|uniref:hypothetical protein n=1 Tax=Pedobacter heparinus TaxID=984 RepID=UPI00292FD37D|nr:hypothetical protein [Pedobacter heparinus]